MMKIRTEKYSNSRKITKKGSSTKDLSTGRPYVQMMELSSNTPLMISSNTAQKVRSRSSLDANEVLNKEHNTKNMGCILTSQ